MGIYIGCHCFNMTNGHASSCVAQFIYADIIRPLKWNTQWAICQKFKAYVTGSLQSYSSCVLQSFKAKCKLDEHSWLEEIVIWLEKKLPGTQNSRFLLHFSLWSSVCVWESFLASDIWQRGGFPEWSHWRQREFHALKDTEPNVQVLERSGGMPLLRQLGGQHTYGRFQVLMETL